MAVRQIHAQAREMKEGALRILYPVTILEAITILARGKVLV